MVEHRQRARTCDACDEVACVVAGTGVVGADWHVAWTSADMAATLGIDPQALAGRPFWDIVHPDDHEAVRQHVDIGCDAVPRPWTQVRLASPTGACAEVCLSMSRTATPGLAFSFVATRQGRAVRPPLPVAPPANERLARLEDVLKRISAEIDTVLPPLRTPRVVAPEVLSRLHGASPRQVEVARRIAAGQRVSSIARDMFLSPSTVRNHLSAIFHQLGIRSQAELVELLTAEPQNGNEACALADTGEAFSEGAAQERVTEGWS